MKKLFLLLISTAITLFGIISTKSPENLTSNLIGHLNEVVNVDAQETKSNLLFESYLVSDFNTYSFNDADAKKDTVTPKIIIDFYKLDSSQYQITLINFHYKINKLLLIRAAV